MRRAINIATTVVLILVLIFAFLLVGMRLFGLEPLVVLSGSMEPEYHVGSLIYVEDVSVADLEIGDPITYKLPSGVLVTHRIVNIVVDPDNLTNVQYETKGDANNAPDGTKVNYKDIIGRPVFSIPIIGFICYFIQNPPGSFIVVGLLLVFVFLAFLPDIIKAFKSEAPEKTEEQIKEEERKKTEADALTAELEFLRQRLANLEGTNPEQSGQGAEIPPQNQNGSSES